MVQAKLPSLIFKIIANIKFAILEMETSVVWEMSNHREKRGQNFGPGGGVCVCGGGEVILYTCYTFVLGHVKFYVTNVHDFVHTPSSCRIIAFWRTFFILHCIRR